MCMVCLSSVEFVVTEQSVRVQKRVQFMQVKNQNNDRGAHYKVLEKKNSLSLLMLIIYNQGALLQFVGVLINELILHQSQLYSFTSNRKCSCTKCSVNLISFQLFIGKQFQVAVKAQKCSFDKSFQFILSEKERVIFRHLAIHKALAYFQSSKQVMTF